VTSLADLDPRVLRDLAAALESNDPALQLRRDLPAAMLEELVALALAGIEPPPDFWARWSRPVDVHKLGERLRAAQRHVHAQLRAASLRKPA
jgi:hypothetical protein